MSEQRRRDRCIVPTIGFACVLLLCSCRESAQDPIPATRFDFGRVSLDAGPQALSHIFTLTNTTSTVLEVLDIKKSCGCVNAKLAKTKLEPGESASLELTLDISMGGQTTHGATLLFSDGTAKRFTLTAYGTRGLKLVPILRTSHVDPRSRRIPLRLYLVDSNGNGESEAPSVIEPDGVSLEFEGWIVLERQTQKKLRPTRQVANTHLNFANYQAEFPVEIRIRSAIGTECTVTVEGPYR